jgi:hypothetical protein
MRPVADNPVHFPVFVLRHGGMPAFVYHN